MKTKYTNTLFLQWLTVILFSLLCCTSVTANETPSDKSEEKEQEDLFKLDEVVVTGTKTPYQLRDAPVHTVVITNKEIKNSSSQSVSDLLRSVPGFFSVSEDIPGVTSWRAKIRGLDMNSGYGLVLVDGQRVKGNGMGEYGYGVNQVPLSMIEKIEVIKGPSSVLYGSDALAGVINIITKPCPDHPIYGMELATGSHSTKIGSIYAGTRKDRLGAYVNASLSQADIGAYGYNESRHEEYNSTRIDTKLNYEFSDQFTADLKLEVENSDRLREYQEEDVTRYSYDRKYRIAPEFNFTIDDKSNAVLTGYYYDWNMNSMETGTDSSGFTPTVGDIYYKDIEARYTRKVKSLFQLTAGAEFLQEELDYNMADEAIDTVSGYAQLESATWDKFTVVLGGRVDGHSKYGTCFSPKLSFMHNLSEETTFRGSVGRGFKSPTIRQLYYTELYQHGTYWYRSNPDLEAEKSWGYSLGVEQAVGKHLYLDLTLFRNDIKDKVIQVDTGETEDDLPIDTYENAASAYTQGAELNANISVTQGLSATLGYAYTDTEDDDTGNELTYVPAHNFTLGLNYTYAAWDLSVSLNGQWVDEMYTDSENTEKTDPYSLFDLKIIKNLGDYYAVSVEGNNLFDSDFGQPDRDWLGPTYLVRFKMDI